MSRYPGARAGGIVHDNPITDDQLARLRAVAEDPMIAPSKRVEARALLKAWREEQDKARGVDVRRRLQEKIRTGRHLSWRERAVARELGLIEGRD